MLRLSSKQIKSKIYFGDSSAVWKVLSMSLQWPWTALQMKIGGHLKTSWQLTSDLVIEENNEGCNSEIKIAASSQERKVVRKKGWNALWTFQGLDGKI